MLSTDQKVANARRTTENINDFLMNEFEDNGSASATPGGSK